MLKNKIYQGKDKTLHQSTDGFIMEYRDNIPYFSNFNSNNCVVAMHTEVTNILPELKILPGLSILPGKASINNRLSAFIFEKLNNIGIQTHFIKTLSLKEQLILPCEMFNFSIVVRNYAKGSLVTRLGLVENAKLEEPLVEFFLKSEQLNYPLVSAEHLCKLGFTLEEEIKDIGKIITRVNDFLSGLFITKNLVLIDFCLEFGRAFEDEEDLFSEILIGDEISLDTMTLFNTKTQEYIGRNEFKNNVEGNFNNYLSIASDFGLITEVWSKQNDNNTNMPDSNRLLNKPKNPENKDDNSQDQTEAPCNNIKTLEIGKKNLKLNS